ncbi:MAG: hypothetical protein GXO48_03135 [Chlorobi bacterium]|nr:hypothetical protein [Chlorobiota bacterium]
MRLINALGFVVLISIQSATAGTLQIVVDSAKWLPTHFQDSLRLKLGHYIKNFPVDILVAVLSDSTMDEALERIKSIEKERRFMTVLVLPKIKDAIIIPHPAIKDTYRLEQVQEQVLKPIVFAGGYYYGIYSALLLLGQTPPEVDTNAIPRKQQNTIRDSLVIDSVKSHRRSSMKVGNIFSSKNISRAIAIIVTLVVAYLSWRRWREYKRTQGPTTE